MNDLIEQRLAVKFCVKLGKSATETFAMLNTAYGGVAMKCTACFKRSPRPKKACRVRSNVKVMLTVYFDAKGDVHHEYLPQGYTVNQTYYIKVLKRLRNAIYCKNLEMWKSGDWFLHHDNAPAHSALRTCEFLAKHSITVLPHPSYTLDLANCDFFLFPKIKKPLKGRRFKTIPEIKANATKALKDITKETYQDCFNKWKHRWDKCCIRKESTLKGTQTCTFYIKYILFYDVSFFTLHPGMIILDVILIWLFPIIIKGTKRFLKEEDLFETSKYHTSEYLGNILQNWLFPIIIKGTKRFLKEEDLFETSKYHTSEYLGNILQNWLFPIIIKGTKRFLKEEDLFETSKYHTSEYLGNILQKQKK
ncbi:uncharacterized protein LOC111627944 [Centruroides sculpturatus]|uniref:uncharacterized protein LOC111627944 n=1 Tax=Centruroides sculpturatus TaxID=218467 RepID=UPI000C6ED5CA|nr:uncharacterized protein LOC111627944 [Centruroides sculpturatus]